MRKFVFWIKKVFYLCIQLPINESCTISENSVMLIRLDAIGDYVLFRNFISELKKSEPYRGRSVILVGNLAWKELALELDAAVVDKFIWLDRRKFSRNLLYRYKKLKEIVSCGCEAVISPVYSREFFYSDWIVRCVNAEFKIGSVGDYSNLTHEQKKISDKWYTDLIPTDSGVMFEFDRNKAFFESLLGRSLATLKPQMKLNPIKLPFELPKKYAVLFIGASAEFRRWDVVKFAEIACYLRDSYRLNIVLCGGPSDKGEAKLFKKHYNSEYLDLVGKLSLIELLHVIAGEAMLLSNETLAPHLAVALDMKNIFVISNGNHYGRFTPYPNKIISNYYVIYHPKIETDITNYKKLSNSYGFGSNLDISEISVESVINKIDENLSLGM